MNAVKIPRIVIGGTNSGAGKTSVALALTIALKRRGLKVQTFKAGPDFLDPSYLSRASGRPCYNLDGWMCGEKYVKELFCRATADADLAIIEGVMGLFDGASPDNHEGSTAELALWLEAPVLLVTNAHGMARSLAALVKGFSEYEPKLNMAGVIANQIGSARHAEWLQSSLSNSGQPGLVGAIPRGAFPELPSRHLGLVTADDRNLSDEVIEQLGDAMEANAELDQIIKLAEAPPLISTLANESNKNIPEDKIKIGLAYDEAFHFYYPDNLELLESKGAELIRFSPLHDECLPTDLDGLYIGGGYPEEYAEALAENQTMLNSIKEFAHEGHGVYAECGGLMYLSQGIETLDQQRHPLVGLLPRWSRMLPRRKLLGYVEVTMMEKSLLGEKGCQFRGHEFHYSELLEPIEDSQEWQEVYSIKRRRNDGTSLEGYQKGNTLLSYVHAHFAAQPEVAQHFIACCKSPCSPATHLPGSTTGSPFPGK